MRSAEYAILAYGAIILSFIGGMQWGITIQNTKINKKLWVVLTISVVPALIGWFSLLAATLTRFIFMIAGFLLALAVDTRMSTLNFTPTWYLRLRIPLTGVVVTCLVINMTY